MNETNPETLALRSAFALDTDVPLPRRKQAMLFCSVARALRRLARRIAFGRLSAADRWRIGRALESLESDILLVRIMTREAPGRCAPGSRPPESTRRRPSDEGSRGPRKGDDEV